MSEIEEHEAEGSNPLADLLGEAVAAVEQGQHVAPVARTVAPAAAPAPPGDDEDGVLEVFDASGQVARVVRENQAPPQQSVPATVIPVPAVPRAAAVTVVDQDIAGARAAFGVQDDTTLLDVADSGHAAKPKDDVFGITYQRIAVPGDSATGPTGPGYTLPQSADVANAVSRAAEANPAIRAALQHSMIATGAGHAAENADEDDEFAHAFDDNAVASQPAVRIPPAAPAVADAAGALAAVRAGIVAQRAAEEAAAVREMEQRVLATSSLVAQKVADTPTETAVAPAPSKNLTALQEESEEDEGEDEEEDGERPKPSPAPIKPATSATVVPAANASASEPPAVVKPVPEPTGAFAAALSPSDVGNDDELAALEAAFESATAVHQQKMEAAASGPAARAAVAELSYPAALAYLILDERTSPFVSSIIPSAPDPDAGCLSRLLAPKLRRELWAERDKVFCVAKMPYDPTNDLHHRVFTSVYRGLVGTDFIQGRSGWTEIGFQRDADFSTDLRAVGMLGGLQMLGLLHTQHVFALKVFELARSDRGFPLLAHGMTVSARTLEALRFGKLTRVIHESSGASPVFTACQTFYNAFLFAFYAMWLERQATIRDMGTILRDVTDAVFRDCHAAVRRYADAMSKDQFRERRTAGSKAGGPAFLPPPVPSSGGRGVSFSNIE